MPAGRLTWIRVLLALTIAVGLGAVLVVVSSGLSQRRSGPPDGVQLPIRDFYSSGLSFQSFSDDGVSFSLEIDEIARRKRKVGPLTVNPVSELVMRGVRLETTSPEPRLFPVSLQSAIGEAISARDLGRVTRVMITGLRIQQRQEGREAITLDAGEARFSMGDRGIRLDRQLRIATPNGDRLIALAATWDPRDDVLVVRGPYMFNQLRESRKDARTRFVIDSAGALRQQ